jgi:hypothetical protein
MTSRAATIVGGLHKLEQLANSVSWTFSSFGQSNNLLSRSVGAIVSTFFSSTRPTIRIIGSPTVQPSPGSRLECTPVEQEIAGLIIGPTDLCDR